MFLKRSGISASRIARHTSWRYGFAAGLTLFACAAQLTLASNLGGQAPFLFLLPAIVLAAALAGRGPGLVVLVGGLVVTLVTLGSPVPVPQSIDQWLILLYVAVGLLLLEMGGRSRDVNLRAHAAEERLRLAIEGTAMGVFDIDLQERTAYVSPGLGRLVGLPVSGEPMPLDAWLESLPADLVAESRASLAGQLRQRATTYERELRLERPGVPEVWLLLRVHIVWEGTRAVRLRGAGIDISERKALDQQLMRTEAEMVQQVEDLGRLHQLSSRLPQMGTLALQLDAILQTVVECHGRASGALAQVDPLTGAWRVVATHACSMEAATALVGAMTTAASREPSTALHERFVVDDIDSDLRCTAWRELARSEGMRAVHGTPLLSRDGVPMGAVLVFFDQAHTPTSRQRTLSDICARKAVVFIESALRQARLEESRLRFEAVLEASAVPFTVLAPVRDDQGTVVDFTFSYLNSAAARELAHLGNPLQGRRWLELLPDSDIHSDSFSHYVAVAQSGQSRAFDVHRVVGHEDRWIHCVASPLSDGVAVWFADISEHKRNEQLLREVDRRKDEFLATLAHELRNTLAPIRHAALLWRTPRMSEEKKRWTTEVIDRQVRHMTMLLDDLFDIARIARGAIQLRLDHVALQGVIEAAVETARPAIDEKQHRLEVVLPDESVTLHADAMRLAQVVSNLLVNAAKFTDPKGEIRLHAAVQGRQLVIEISDNGIGIAAEALPDLFQMFKQLSDPDERYRGGLGIGLALSKRLIDLHRGSLDVHSAGVGEGCTVTVRLPVSAAPTFDAASPSSEAQSGGAGDACRVLIADDNSDAATSLAELLKLLGYTVEVAFDGDQALAVFEHFRPHACLFDIDMPGLSGYEVARAIRHRADGHDVVLIAVTGLGRDDERRRSSDAGFDEHLTKPVDPQWLTSMLQRAAGRPPDGAAGAA